MGSETLMDDSSSAPRWWQTRNGKQVVALGILMGSAYGAALLVPSYGAWVFALAVVAGVFPFARRALALARSGTPVSIGTLMAGAALGGLVMGWCQEVAGLEEGWREGRRA